MSPKVGCTRQEQRLLLRVLFILLFAFICFLQCYSIIKSYLRYPRIINMYDESPSLISILPGLTVCNNNRVSLKKVMRLNDTLRRAMEQKFTGQLIQNGQIKSLPSRAKFNQFRDELAKFFERQNVDPQAISLKATMNDLFEYRPDTQPFIDWFGCARTWKDSISCENLTRIESVTSRKCTTLLHSGAMVYDAYNRPELFNATSEASNSLSYFDAKEVIKIVLNFEPEDYADLKRQIGARISFHSGKFVAAIGDLDFFVTRGYRYDFSIDRKDTKLIGSPYDKCLDYQRENIDKFKIRVDPRVPLAAHTCVQNCMARNVLNKMNCWPPTMPYFRNDSLDPDLKIKFCPWFKGSHRALYYELLRLDNYRRRKQAVEAANATGQQSAPPAEITGELVPESDLNAFASTNTDNMRNYREISRFCWSKCTLTCRMVHYTVSVTRSAWPTDVEILFDSTGRKRAKRHCCALIAIKFTHFHYSIHEYQPKYEFVDTVGDLGGLLAFWLGLSIVSIYKALQKLVELCSNRSLNKIRDIKSRSLRTDEHPVGLPAASVSRPSARSHRSRSNSSRVENDQDSVELAI